MCDVQIHRPLISSFLGETHPVVLPLLQNYSLRLQIIGGIYV
jgi:hypothetical protein